MEKSTLLAALTFFTLLSGMAIGAYHLWVTEQAKKKGLGGPMLKDSLEARAGKDAEIAARKARAASAEPVPPSPPVADAQGHASTQPMEGQSPT